MLQRQKSIRNCMALFHKQKLEILRNKKNLILFLIFPIALSLMSALNDNTMQSLLLFVIMGDVMPPMISIASQVAEEREKGIIRGLIYIGVNSIEYLFGMMLCTAIFSFIASCIMCMIIENKYSIDISVETMLIHLAAIVCSMIIGAIIGVLAKNQVSVSTMTVPISLCTLFISIFGMAEDKIHALSQYLYSQVVIDVALRGEVSQKSLIIMSLNLLVLLTGFILMYQKRKKEEE